MKNNTLNTIYSALLDFGYESTDPIMEEISKELNRDAKAREANAAKYATLWEVVNNVLNDALAPLTIAEIYTEINNPEIKRGSIQYGLTFLWKDMVVKSDGKPATYTLKR